MHSTCCLATQNLLQNIFCPILLHVGALESPQQASNAFALGLNMGNATEMRQLCPTWMADYAAFHNRNRYSPSAKYLIYLCSHSRADDYKRPAIERQTCNGLADRLKGIMFLTRLAAASNRILIINNTQPVDLTEGLMPTAFDWRVHNLSVPCDNMNFPCSREDSDGHNLSAAYWSAGGAYRKLPVWLISGNSSGLLSNITHVYMTPVQPPHFSSLGWVPALPELPLRGSQYHCLFSLLFKAADSVDKQVNAFLAQAWNTLPVRSDLAHQPAYVGEHLRMKIDRRRLSEVRQPYLVLCRVTSSRMAVRHVLRCA